MTNGEIIEQLENAIELIKQDGKDWLDDRDIPILEVCIKTLDQEPCDAVSREAAVNACLNGWNKDYKEIVADIRALPSVTPAGKVGHWIANGETFRCSECGELACCQGRYCNECGAKMQEVEKKE